MVGTAANRFLQPLPSESDRQQSRLVSLRSLGSTGRGGEAQGPPLTGGEVSRASRDLGEDESWVVAGAGPLLV